MRPSSARATSACRWRTRSPTPALGASIDISPELVDALNRGESHITDVPSDELSRPHRRIQRPRSTTSPKRGRDPDRPAHPLSKQRSGPLDRDLGDEQIAARLRTGHLVILESTTYPRTTREVIQPILERSSSGRRDFHLAFSPERVDPGNETWTTKNVPKIVGGITPAPDRAAQFYGGR